VAVDAVFSEILPPTAIYSIPGLCNITRFVPIVAPVVGIPEQLRIPPPSVHCELLP
jgi:hypothetical protein